MKKEKAVSTYKRGDKLDIFFLFILTLLIGLLTLGNISIPSLTSVDSSKAGVSFFNLNYFSYFTEIPLSLIFSIPIAVVTIGLIILLMIRRKNKEIVLGKKKLLFLIGFIIVAAFYVAATLFIIPSSGSATAKLLGSDISSEYTISNSYFTTIYKISYLVSFVSFLFYLYFLLFYLRSFNYCLNKFISLGQLIVVLMSIAFFLGVFFNTHSQDIIINNFNALMNKSDVAEVTHPIISNSLFGFSIFIGCLSSCIMFYRRPRIYTYILSLIFSFAAFLTGNPYSLALCLLSVVLTNILSLFNTNGHTKITIVSLILTVLLIAFIVLSITALRNMFSGVNNVIVNYIDTFKTSLSNDIYLWKVAFSTVLSSSIGYSGFTPYLFAPIIYSLSSSFNVVNNPVSSTRNLFTQTLGSFGYIGIGLLLISYIFIMIRCFSMLKNKKKAGLYYFFMTLVIIVSSLFSNYGLLGYSPLSILFTVIFIYPLSTDCHSGLVTGKEKLKPGEMKEVEHKYVRYDVQADDINQDNSSKQDNIDFKEAEYVEGNNHEEEIESLNLPNKEQEEQEEAKKKIDNQHGGLVDKSIPIHPGKIDNFNDADNQVHQTSSINVVGKKVEPIKEEKKVEEEKEPDVLILKELPSSTIREDDLAEEQVIKHDDELLSHVVESQTRYKEEPIMAHYKKAEKKVNTAMLSQKAMHHPTGKVVNRRLDIDYANSYEIIENKAETISEDNTIAKPQTKVILNYDDYSKIGTEDPKKVVQRNYEHSTNTLYDFNKEKQKEKEKEDMSKKIDNILHKSTPPKKDFKTNTAVFDNLLNNKKLVSISIDDFKNRDKHVKEEIELLKKMKESENKEINVPNNKELSNFSSFGSLLETPVKEDEDELKNDIEKLKQNKKHYSTPKIKVIKEGEKRPNKGGSFFDDLL